MATKNASTKSSPVSIEMPKGKDCKGSVRFETADPNAVVTNIYVDRSMPGISEAKKVKVTVEVIE